MTPPTPLGRDARIGTRVHAYLDDQTQINTTTRSKPYQLDDGRWVVLLKDRNGPYPLSRVALAPTWGRAGARQ